VIEKDLEIDHSEVEVEEECLRILALHQPVAIDLRFIVAALKLNNDLERIGDLAVNIAERALFLSRVTPPVIPFDFNEMAQRTRDMLKQSLDALVNMDIELARRVCAEDDEVDRINREMYVHVKQAIRQHPHHLEALVHLLSVSRHLERIADHTTNIAEDVIYMIEGEIVRHKTEDFEHDLAADMEH
jgi:phosphate transport system protein